MEIYFAIRKLGSYLRSSRSKGISEFVFFFGYLWHSRGILGRVTDFGVDCVANWPKCTVVCTRSNRLCHTCHLESSSHPQNHCVSLWRSIHPKNYIATRNHCASTSPPAAAPPTRTYLAPRSINSDWRIKILPLRKEGKGRMSMWPSKHLLQNAFKV